MVGQRYFDMKIYFEDGELRKISDVEKELIREDPLISIDHIIEAKYGYHHNEKFLDAIRAQFPNDVVYTNQIAALNNRYAWNAELKVPEVYIRNRDGRFTRIDNLTNRELREGHNLMRMYIANEFGNFDWM